MTVTDQRLSDESRCDVCTVRHSESPILWTYRTADSLSVDDRERLMAMTKPDQQHGILWVDKLPWEESGFVFQDPEWAVCQPCHELICDGDLRGIIERNFEQQWGAMIVIGPEEGREQITEMLRESQAATVHILFAFWTHRIGEPVPA